MIFFKYFPIPCSLISPLSLTGNVTSSGTASLTSPYHDREEDYPHDFFFFPINVILSVDVIFVCNDQISNYSGLFSHVK